MAEQTEQFTLSEEIENSRLFGADFNMIVSDIKSKMQPGQYFTLLHDQTQLTGRQAQERRESYYGLKKALHASFGDNGTNYYVNISDNEDGISLQIARRTQERLVAQTLRAGVSA